jgi:hypothetical protein
MKVPAARQAAVNPSILSDPSLLISFLISSAAIS